MTTAIIITNLLLLASLVALGVQMRWLHRQGTSSSYEQTRDEMRRHIVWKLFYINPADPRAWVPKTWGPGYTVNFRTRGQAVLFSFIICATFAAAIGMCLAVL